MTLLHLQCKIIDLWWLGTPCTIVTVYMVMARPDMPVTPTLPVWLEQQSSWGRDTNHIVFL